MARTSSIMMDPRPLSAVQNLKTFHAIATPADLCMSPHPAAVGTAQPPPYSGKGATRSDTATSSSADAKGEGGGSPKKSYQFCKFHYNNCEINNLHLYRYMYCGPHLPSNLPKRCKLLERSIVRPSYVHNFTKRKQAKETTTTTTG